MGGKGGGGRRGERRCGPVRGERDGVQRGYDTRGREKGRFNRMKMCLGWLGSIP